MPPISIVNFLISFIAGFLTFFAGCLVPIAPVYVSYLSASGPVKEKSKLIFLKNAFLFTLGFVSVFFVMGATINSLARSVAMYSEVIRLVSAVLIIFLGLLLGEFIKIDLFYKTYSINRRPTKSSLAGGFVLGALFAFSWTPCVGPVLATILLWISFSQALPSALILLFSFSLGLSLPFLLIGLSFDFFYPKLKILNKYGPNIKKISGILLIIFGVLMLTGIYGTLSAFVLKNSETLLDLKLRK